MQRPNRTSVLLSVVLLLCLSVMAKAQFVSDTLAGTGGTLITSAHSGQTTGATWTTITGSSTPTFGDCSTGTYAGVAMRNLSSSGGLNVYASGTPSGMNYTAQFDVNFLTLVTSDNYELFLRCAGTSNTGYITRINPDSGQIQIYTRIAGTGTLLGTPASWTPTANTWYTFYTSVVSNSGNTSTTVSAWVTARGSSTHLAGYSVTDSTSGLQSSAGYVGLSGNLNSVGSDSTGPIMENFLAYNLATQSFAITEQQLPSNHNGNVTVHAVGTGTSWSGSTAFTINSFTGWSLVSATNVDATHETLVLSAPAVATPPAGTTGVLTVNDTTDTLSATTNIATPTLVTSPTSSLTSTTPTITFTGANTLWSVDNPQFTITTLTGTSMGTSTDTSNTASTGTLTVGATSGTIYFTDPSTGAKSAAFTIALATATITQQNLPSNHNGNITVNLVGVGTSWTTSTTWTPSGVSGWTVASKTYGSATTYTVVLTPPAAASPPSGATGTLTLTEGVTGSTTPTTTIGTPTLSVSPSSASAGAGATTLTLTGTYTLWATDNPQFTISTLTGTSIGTATETSNTASGATLTVGSTTGTTTITDPSTGATVTFTVTTGSVVVSVTNSLLYASPLNWKSISSTGAMQANNVKAGATKISTTQPGSYIKFAFNEPSSGTISIQYDTSVLSGNSVSSANYPILKWSIDNGAYVNHQMASGDGGTYTLGTGLSAGTHTIIMYVEAVSGLVDAWNTPIEAVVVNSFTLASGSSGLVSASGTDVAVQPNILCVITASDGVGENITSYTNPAIGGYDASLAYPVTMAFALKCELAVIGWPGAGYNSSVSNSNVPTEQGTGGYILNYDANTARDLTVVPKYVVCTNGANSGPPTSAMVQTEINELRTTWPASGGTYIFECSGFQFTQSLDNNVLSAKQSAVTSVIGTTGDTKLFAIAGQWIDGMNQSGTASRTSFDGIHPNRDTSPQTGAYLVQQIQSSITGSGSTSILKRTRQLNRTGGRN